jgi:hypothetical protein
MIKITQNLKKEMESTARDLIREGGVERNLSEPYADFFVSVDSENTQKNMVLAKFIVSEQTCLLCQNRAEV